MFTIWTCGTHLCCLKPFSLVSVIYLWLKFLGPHSAMSSANNLLHHQGKAAIETIFLYFPNTGNSWFNTKTNTAKLCCQQCLSLGIIQGRKENKWQKAPAPITTMCAHTANTNILLWHCRQEFLRIQVYRTFLASGIGTNVIQRLSFIAAFPFVCSAFRTKHSKRERVTCTTE